MLLRTGELDEARAECVKAMKYPYDGAVFWAPYVLAIIEHKRGHLEEARQQLQRAKAANKPARNKMHFRGFLAIEALGREATQLIEPGG